MMGNDNEHGTMTLSYTLLEEGEVSILITAPGMYQQGFTISKMPAGRYHLHIRSGNSSRTLPAVKL